MIAEVDEDDSGEVEFNEFVQILFRQRESEEYCPSLQLALLFSPDELDNIRKQFRLIDTGITKSNKNRVNLSCHPV